MQTDPLGFLAFPAKRAYLEPRDPKERKGTRERKVTQGRTEWGSQGPPGPPDSRGPLSTCQRIRTEQCL